MNETIIICPECGSRNHWKDRIDILVLEKYNDITVETVAIDFLKGPLQFPKTPLFFSLFCLCAVCWLLGK